MGRAGNHIQDGVEKHMEVLSLHVDDIQHHFHKSYGLWPEFPAVL